MAVPSTAVPGMTSMGYRVGSSQKIPTGQYTAIVYTLLSRERYEDVIQILSAELQSFPKSRAALSLTAYCHYNMEDYESAAQFYERLVKVFPKEGEYKLAYAQSLYKCGKYAEAQRAVLLVESPELQQDALKLQACIRYDEGDVASTKALVEQCPAEEADTIVNQGCLLYKEGRYDLALAEFSRGLELSGFSGVIAYYIALCYYRLRQYDVAMQWLTQIIDRAIVDYPQFPVVAIEQGLVVREVSNSQTLHESGLVQAFNLKAAIAYVRENLPAARDALVSMPPRKEEDLDPVTLHNQALVNMAEDPQGGFEKFRFLLQTNPCPPETFGNLLLLYCKYQFYDIAADVMTEYADLANTCLLPEVFEYIDATILQQTAPEEAYRKFDALATTHVETLRGLIKNLQAAVNRDTDALHAALVEYNDALEAYLPVLMAQARIYWDRENFSKVESILFQSVEFFYLDVEEDPRVKDLIRQMGPVALDSEVWRLNLAHVFFMQPKKHLDAIKYYEPIVHSHEDDLLEGVAAIVLANLCVSFCLATQNDRAEAQIRLIEQAEAAATAANPDKHYYHSCIVKLVLGTLYLAKTHYDFGIGQIIKAFEPIDRNLNTDTWFYAKRCFMAFLETQAKHETLVSDDTFRSMVAFLEEAEAHGRAVPTVISFVAEHPVDAATNNVAWEARQIKLLLLKLRSM